MKPQFSWKSDRLDPEVKSGIARWDFGGPGNFVEVEFSDFKEALLIDTLIHQTHSSGYSAGIHHMSDAIKVTLERFT